MNKIIFTIALLFGVMLSCENVEVAETEEFVLTEIEVNEILDSDEFKKIRHASNKFFLKKRQYFLQKNMIKIMHTSKKKTLMKILMVLFLNFNHLKSFYN